MVETKHQHRTAKTARRDPGHKPMYEEQLSRWQTPAPTEAQQQEITRLNRQLAELRGVLTAALALADDMKDSTIEKIMAKDDFELGLDFLMGKHKLD